MEDHAAIEILRRAVPGLIAIYRFGSRAKGTDRPDSDVDLAVLGPSPLAPVQRFELAQEIAARIRRDVDLVDLQASSTVLRMQVVSTGECLFSSDDATRQRFEAYVFSAYARLNEERREILKRVRKEGRIYA